MVSSAEGRCRFCSKRHTVSVLGNNEAEHETIRKLSLKLIILNTVCNSCIAVLEAHLKDSRLPSGEESSRRVNGSVQRKATSRVLHCEFCEKEFTHTGDLRKHRRTHTGEQPYVCEKCEQRFSHASNLARHRRVHTGERPFACERCKRSFSRKDKLLRHMTARLVHERPLLIKK